MSTESLADELNRSCHCINVDEKALQRSLEARFGEPGSYSRLRQTHPNLLADYPVFIARGQIARMQAVVDAIEHVVTLEPYQRHVLAWAPDIATMPGGAHGVFFGYDFHLTNEGPRLIEVNTNAGGALLLNHVAAAQQACCRAVGDYFPGPKDVGPVERKFVDMFREDLQATKPNDELRRIAIVDEDPDTQYLKPEFELFQQMFSNHGIEAAIADPTEFSVSGGELRVAGEAVDLVYNRLTDFYLQSEACATLREALETGAAVFTPGPRAHALYANKRNLTVLCDAEALREMGASSTAIETLSTIVPRTMHVDEGNADALWSGRRQLYFKPVSGFGSRGTYRGAKLTKKVWTSILGADYVAQQRIAPSERLLIMDGARRALKVDVRCYVYRGEIQLLGARMYQGQATNFRTDGGGLAAVFTTP